MNPVLLLRFVSVCVCLSVDAYVGLIMAAAAKGTTAYEMHSINEFFHDLNTLNKIIAFGPAKSFCYQCVLFAFCFASLLAVLFSVLFRPRALTHCHLHLVA